MIYENYMKFKFQRLQKQPHGNTALLIHPYRLWLLSRCISRAAQLQLGPYGPESLTYLLQKRSANCALVCGVPTNKNIPLRNHNTTIKIRESETLLPPNPQTPNFTNWPNGVLHSKGSIQPRTTSWHSVVLVLVSFPLEQFLGLSSTFMTSHF